MTLMGRHGDGLTPGSARRRVSEVAIGLVKGMMRRGWPGCVCHGRRETSLPVSRAPLRYDMPGGAGIPASVIFRAIIFRQVRIQGFYLSLLELFLVSSFIEVAFNLNSKHFRIFLYEVPFQSLIFFFATSLILFLLDFKARVERSCRKLRI